MQVEVEMNMGVGRHLARFLEGVAKSQSSRKPVDFKSGDRVRIRSIFVYPLEHSGVAGVGAPDKLEALLAAKRSSAAGGNPLLFKLTEVSLLL